MWEYVTLAKFYNFRMVQYVVKSKDKIPKWTIIELQGELEVRNGAENNSFNGRYFGDLHFDASNTPILILGHHILQGKIQKLDKPFAVIEKEDNAPDKQFSVKGSFCAWDWKSDPNFQLWWRKKSFSNLARSQLSPMCRQNCKLCFPVSITAKFPLKFHFLICNLKI